MKKIFTLAVICLTVMSLASCKNNKKAAEEPAAEEEGFVAMFDGETFNGWRGYAKENVPGAWVIEDGCIKINGSGRGEAGAVDGGDIIYTNEVKNFEFTFEWKVAQGSNSGVFYMAKEIQREDGSYLPIYYSAPEYQILDNENHPDAKLGVDGNRQSASLYDMIPANPQNSKPFGEWNTGKIIVYKGTVVHYQNGEKVLEYHLWTPEWKALVDASKFGEAGPCAEAYPYMLKAEDDGTGFIGLQDHGDDVWYRNLKLKVLE